MVIALLTDRRAAMPVSTTNLGVESQHIHVKIASIESPVVLLIALYVWYRARPILRPLSV